MAHAAASQSMPVVTAYDTLGPSGVEHSLLQTRPKAMYLDPHLLNVAKGPIQTADSVEYIIYNDATTHPIPEKDLDDWKAAHPNHTCISFSDLLQLGQDNSADPVPPKPQDIFCIMYTSGSTGSPKGVPVSHAQFVAAIAGLHSCIGEVVGQAECVLAYLPLAHIFELVLENLAMFVGATVGYGSPRTLSDASMRNCVGDMRELRPTLMVGVPQIWEAIKKGVIGKVSKASTITQTLFWTAFSVKSWLVAHNLPFQTIFDSLVFGQVRAMTGGRVRAIVNGASGIADGTRHFMSMVVAPMVTGYGLTETGANGALGNPLQYTPDAIGPITASIEVKLVAIPDLGYSTETTPPQGEILIRGGPTVVEYWQNPEETAKAIMPDGWFKTGDVGEFDANGHLKVIDRVKNLVKMQGGEYVALDKLESVYRGSPLAQNVMIFASSEQPRPVAVVSANGKLLAELAQKMGVEESRMCQDAAVRKAVLKDLLQAGKEGGLTALETIVGVVVVEEEWTPASGFVTATQKLDRRALNKKYMEDIKNCYGQK